MRFRVTINLNTETLQAIDWREGAPLDQQVARSQIESLLRGMLEVALAKIVIDFREAARL